jgi:hypothetical protein
VTWVFEARAYADSDAIDQAWGTAQHVHDTLITHDDMHITDATPALTVGGTPHHDQPIILHIYRDISDDDLNADARLLGIWIEYTEAATEEAAW